jgi:hypothetical protein
MRVDIGKNLKILFPAVLPLEAMTKEIAAIILANSAM